MNISFIHSGTPEMASYRYRAAIPARELGGEVNGREADIYVFSKPMPHEVAAVKQLQKMRRTVVVDICDNHFDRFKHYGDMVEMADVVTCPTPWMKHYIESKFHRTVHVIGDCYEMPVRPPHCGGSHLLWFGHGVNFSSLERVLPQLTPYPLRIVSNVVGTIPWPLDTLEKELEIADIVILPATALYKSPNRAIEAIRSGCFVVAEPHPSLVDFPIYKGDIVQGIEWTKRHLKEAHEMILLGQDLLESKYSPKTQANAWRSLLNSVCTSVPVAANGTDG